jgi:hypothetical protein
VAIRTQAATQGTGVINAFHDADMAMYLLSTSAPTVGVPDGSSCEHKPEQLVWHCSCCMVQLRCRFM